MCDDPVDTSGSGHATTDEHFEFWINDVLILMNDVLNRDGAVNNCCCSFKMYDGSVELIYIPTT